MTTEEILEVLRDARKNRKRVIIKLRTQKNETVEIPLDDPELTLGNHIESKIITNTDWFLEEEGHRIVRNTLLWDGMHNLTFIENIFEIKNIEDVKVEED